MPNCIKIDPDGIRHSFIRPVSDRIWKLIPEAGTRSLDGMPERSLKTNHSPILGTTKVLGKAEQAESALRRAIQSGRWKEKLPGSRELAGHLGISAGTLGKVLKRMEAAGMIRSSGPKARYRLPDLPVSGPEHPQDIRTLLVLIPKEVGKTTSGAHWQLVARLAELMAPRGWRVRSHTAKIAGETTRTKHWDRLVAMENPDAVVAILGNRTLAEWAKRRHLRILFCGGTAGGSQIPIIGVSTSAMMERALKALIDHGHERITFPLCGRNQDFVRNVIRKFKLVSDERGVRFRQTANLPIAPSHGPRELQRIYQRIESSFHPTAWICLDWAEFLWVKRQIESQGRRIPDDVSVVCLSSDDAIGWIEPAPSHFEHPLEGMARAIAKWVKDPDATSVMDVTATWVPGKTVGPAK